MRFILDPDVCSTCESIRCGMWPAYLEPDGFGVSFVVVRGELRSVAPRRATGIFLFCIILIRPENSRVNLEKSLPRNHIKPMVTKAISSLQFGDDNNRFILLL